MKGFGLYRLVRWLAVVSICAWANFVLSPSAFADCSVTNVAMPNLQQMPKIMVPWNLAVGDTIPNTLRSFTLTGQCTSAGNVYANAPIVSCYYGTGTEVTPGVYSTGVPGVGIRLRNSKGQPMTNAAGVYCDTRAAGLGNLSSSLSYSFSVTTEFVKTGNITSGTIVQSQTWFGFGVYLANASGALGGGGKNYIGFNGDVNVQSLTCQVNTPSTVTLRKVGLNEMPNVGSTARPENFNIGLRCDSSAVVGITFDAAPGTSIASSANGVFGNQSGSTMATGIGVQLASSTSGQSVPLRQRNALGSIAPNVQSNYPYQFRYYRTSSVASSGAVSGAMVFTFDYQ